MMDRDNTRATHSTGERNDWRLLTLDDHAHELLLVRRLLLLMLLLTKRRRKKKQRWVQSGPVKS